MHTVLTDLLLLFMCHRHVNNCIQLSTLRGATISNTVLCTLPIFSVVKSNLFMRALLHVAFLLRKKLRVRLAYASRTPRVHLVNHYCQDLLSSALVLIILSIERNRMHFLHIKKSIQPYDDIVSSSYFFY